MSIGGVDYSYTYPSKHYYLSTKKSTENSVNSADTTSKDGDTFTSTADTATPVASSGKLSTSSLFGFESKKGGSISLKELFKNTNERLSTFSDQVKKLLNEQGVDTSIPFSLGSEYGTGNVIVTSDHPDKGKIEDFFADNFDLRNEFTFINSQLEIRESFKEAEKFQTAYAQDPIQAVAQYSYLFKTHIESTIEISDESSAHFERKLNL